jgi:peroxiredoxin
LVQLQASLKELEATGGQIVAIGYDSTDILSRFAAKHSITYPLLSDAGSKTIEAYGILNREAQGRTKGIPYPGTFIVGTDGVIRAKFFLEGYKERIDPESIRQALQNAKLRPNIGTRRTDNGLLTTDR